MHQTDWFPWFKRIWFRIPVARCECSDFLGSGYVFKRENGRVVKFWTTEGARKYAQDLNESENRHER